MARPVNGFGKAAPMARGAASGPAGYDRRMESSRAFDGRPGVTDTLGRAMRDLRISRHRPLQLPLHLLHAQGGVRA